jgi:hypothetical protein
MVLETRVIRRLALVASAAWLALVLPGPARADNNWWNSMLGMIGMGPNKPADDAIDYSARPALVVPPKMDLPPPQAAVARPPDWPNDPDAAARRRAEADSRRPAPPAPPAPADDNTAGDSNQPTPAAAAPAPNKSKAAVAPSGDFSSSMGLAGGGTSIFSGGGGALDLSSLNLSNWNPFSSKDDSKAVRTLKVGAEPPREYLTQPPPGYRAPVAVDDSTQDASDPADAAASAPDQTVKKVSADK